MQNCEIAILAATTLKRECGQNVAPPTHPGDIRQADYHCEDEVCDPRHPVYRWLPSIVMCAFRHALKSLRSRGKMKKGCASDCHFTKLYIEFGFGHITFSPFVGIFVGRVVDEMSAHWPTEQFVVGHEMDQCNNAGRTVVFV